MAFLHFHQILDCLLWDNFPGVLGKRRCVYVALLCFMATFLQVSKQHCRFWKRQCILLYSTYIYMQQWSDWMGVVLLLSTDHTEEDGSTVLGIADRNCGISANWFLSLFKSWQLLSSYKHLLQSVCLSSAEQKPEAKRMPHSSLEFCSGFAEEYYY